MTHIGFTGSQGGMTTPQLRAFIREIETESTWSTTFHHGDCIGADATADALARALDLRIHIHPPLIRTKQANCWRKGDTRSRPKPYLNRNHDIVQASKLLIATPSGPEKLRSGTWATIRRARYKGIPITIIWPDGTVTREGAVK